VLGDDADAATFVASLGPDAAMLAEVARSPAAVAAQAQLDELVHDRRMILRIDRVEPSKNIVRGFATYDQLLERHPEWRTNVVFVALLNPSRQSLPQYVAYQEAVEVAAAAVNDRWGTSEWTPVVCDTRDDFAESIAALERYDVLYVNPVKDGLNLVAKEGPLCNQRDGIVCLSPEAGAFEELEEAVIPVHPFDIDQNVGALHRALSVDARQRQAMSARLRSLAAERTPRDWLDAQLRAAG
jgi:trehalose 6-phosphate synthase